MEIAILDLIFGFACGKGAAENHFFRILGDIDEAAAAHHASVEFADIDIARRIGLGQAQKCQIQPAAVIEIKDGRMGEEGIRIGGGADIQTSRRNPADGAGFDGHINLLIYTFLQCDGSDAFGYADAQIDDISFFQLPGTAFGNDFSQIHFHFIDAVLRHPHFAGVGRVIFRQHVHFMVFLFGHHDIIHQDAGHHDVHGMQAAPFGNAFHLGDDDAAAVFRRLGHLQHFRDNGFLFDGDIAECIGCGAPDETHMDGAGLIQKLLHAADVMIFHDILRGCGIHFTPFHPGVCKGSQAHMGEHTHPAAADGPEQMGHHALGQVIGGDFIFIDQAAQFFRQADMAADNEFYHFGVGKMIQTKIALAAVAVAGGKHQGQVLGVAAFLKYLFDVHTNFFGEARAAGESAHGQGVSIFDQFGSLIAADDF